MSPQQTTVYEQLTQLTGPARSGQRRWTRLAASHVSLPVGYRAGNWEVEAFVDCMRMLAWRHV